MNLFEFISKLNTNEDIFGELFIKGIKNRRFSKKNLLIGENGAGKSRFLQVVNKAAEEDGIPTLFLDFTKIKPEYISPDNNKYIAAADDNKNRAASDSVVYNRTDIALLANLIEAVESGFDVLHEDLQRVGNRHNTIYEINQHLKDSLGRSLKIENGKSYISRRKSDEFVDLNEEIPLLSPGERSLLYTAIGIHILLHVARENGDILILIDEPETHLHPAALVNVIKLIKKLEKVTNKKIYLFIASHSVFLLPHFLVEETIYITNGEIKRLNNNIYRNLYKSLIDNEERNLYDFMASEFEWQYVSYISECFKSPVNKNEADKKDMQASLLKKFMMGKLNYAKENNISVDVLDFGSGSGRIGRCITEKILSEQDCDESKLILEHLKYHVYDSYEVDGKIINGIDEECIIEYINKATIPFLGDIIDANKLNKYEKTFDSVLLFNVLHEVDVLDWSEKLKTILSLLKDDGYLVFSERRTLSKGEKPFGKSGYLVLNEDEIKTLLSTKEIELLNYEDSERGILVCCAIKKSDISKNPNNEIVKNTISKLKQRMDENINNYFTTEKTTKPREYAFCCQQYFNARYAISLLDNTESYKPDISKYTLPDILDIEDETKRNNYLETRAKFNNDEEAIRCRKYLLSSLIKK